MIGMVADPELPSDDGRHARGGPDITAKAERLGPCASNTGICARCSAVSFGAAPRRGRRFKASSPPSRPRRIHWLTAPAVTPNASAIFCWLHPFAFKAQARSRRSSRHSFARPVSCAIPQRTAQFGPA